MLEIFDEMAPFFEDTHRPLHVRAYARERGISPPTAALRLRKLAEEGLLVKESFDRYHLYRADRASPLFQGLARLYWQKRLSAILSSFQERLLHAPIILFGSLAKGENTHASDVDLYIDTAKNVGSLPEKLSATLRRPVQLHTLGALRNPQLAKAIKDGVKLS
jgi:predicted nucleotidyltransferase